MSKSLTHGTHGYTFIELLVAITILSFVITPFLGLFTFGFHSIALSGRQTTAINLCRDKLELVKANRFSDVCNHYLVEGSTPEEEDYIPDNPGYSRITEVSMLTLHPTDHPQLSIDFLQIKITVSWTDRDREYRQVLESYFADR